MGIINTYSAIATHMRLTSLTDFGLRMLMRMAGDAKRAFSSAELAKALGLSRNHLAKIIQHLAWACLIDTRRSGGAGLARSAAKIRLGHIIRLLEEGQPFAEGPGKGDGTCSTVAQFRLKARLRSAEAAFMSDLDRSTIADAALTPLSNTQVAQ